MSVLYTKIGGDLVPVATSSPPGAGAALLALKTYWPLSQGTWTTTSTTLVDVDATNAAVTFIAPASGSVILRLQALATNSSAGIMYWGLREDSTSVVEPVQVVNGNTNILVRTVDIPISGLTPGNTYTYKFAWKMGSAITGTIYYGSASGDGRAPVVMAVYDAAAGGGVTAPIGTTAGTAAAGDDPRLSGQKTINAQTGTTYTFVLSDAGKFVTFSNASAVTVTVPTNASVAFPVGTVIEGTQRGAGQVTFAGAGITFEATPGLKIAAQYGSYALVKLATDTWSLIGRLSA